MDSETFINEFGVENPKNGGKWHYSDGYLTTVSRYEHYVNCKLHSVNDEPAVILEESSVIKIWYKDGLLHRDTLNENGYINPAKIEICGDDNDKCFSYEWWTNGELNRSERNADSKLLPAIIDNTLETPLIEFWIEGKKCNIPVSPETQKYWIETIDKY